MDVGEEIVRCYLKHVLNCDFAECSVSFPDRQGDVDVIGVNLHDRIVYVCEVAIHLDGLHYVNSKTNQPDNVARLLKKFAAGVAYARNKFPEYTLRCMLWSPVVKGAGAGAKFNQERDVEEIKSSVKATLRVELDAVVSDEFWRRLVELRDYAHGITSVLGSPIMRLMQIEERLQDYLGDRPKPAAQELPQPAQPQPAGRANTIIGAVLAALDDNPDLTEEEMAALAKSVQPDTAFKRSHYAWYRWEWRRRRAAVGVEQVELRLPRRG